jgi:GFO/IDH/MocA C-terminal domain
MLEVSRRTGQICMTGFMKRFAPVYRKARAAVSSPAFGTVSMLAASWSFGVDDRDWIDMFLLDFGVHMIDLTRYLAGEVAEVYARDCDGAAYAATVAFSNGAALAGGLAGPRREGAVEGLRQEDCGRQPLAVAGDRCRPWHLCGPEGCSHDGGGVVRHLAPGLRDQETINRPPGSRAHRTDRESVRLGTDDRPAAIGGQGLDRRDEGRRAERQLRLCMLWPPIADRGRCGP